MGIHDIIDRYQTNQNVSLLIGVESLLESRRLESDREFYAQKLVEANNLLHDIQALRMVARGNV